MRELRITESGRVYLFPVPVLRDRKYLIACDSVEEAQKIAGAVASGKLTHPDLISPHFKLLTTHSDQQTKIFIPTLEALEIVKSS